MRLPSGPATWKIKADKPEAYQSLPAIRAYKLIRDQLRVLDTTRTNYANGGGTHTNLFDAHPPFQIDGKFGTLSGITEMLLQSHLLYDDPTGADRYIIHFFPALPSDWQQGEIRGIRARGGVEVDLARKGNKAVFATLRPAVDSAWRLLAPKGQKIAGNRSVAMKALADGTGKVRLAKGRFTRLRLCSSSYAAPRFSSLSSAS